MPVQIDAELFRRMVNNYVIIEVWTKIVTDSTQEKLIGIVKVPLNFFHASLNNQDVAR